MKFPGRRKIKHYFPVNDGNRFDRESTTLGHVNTYICGIDQNMVDIYAHVDGSVLADFGLTKAASQWVDNDTANRLYTFLQNHQLIDNQYAGGTIGNTLHNYSILADDRSIQFGVMSQNIRVGDYAYGYLCNNTSSKVDMTFLQPVEGAIGRCYTLITPDGERSFAISPGSMNDLSDEFIPEEIISGSSVMVLCAYTLGDDSLPIYHATLKAARVARDNNIPVVLTLGTSMLVEKIREPLKEFIRNHVTLVAMNEEEACALTGESDPMLACNAILDMPI